MTVCPTHPISTADAPDTWLARTAHWLAEARSHRVICLLLGIWLLNGFDLVFTIISHQHGLLQEENPLAQHMLKHGTTAIVLFKIGMVLIGTYPLLRFRRTRVAELASFTILAAYTLLAVQWSLCFEQYTMAASQSINFANMEIYP